MTTVYLSEIRPFSGTVKRRPCLTEMVRLEFPSREGGDAERVSKRLGMALLN